MHKGNRLIIGLTVIISGLIVNLGMTLGKLLVGGL